MEESVLLQTIKKMVDSGLSDQAIFNTLLDVGVPKKQALSLIDKVRGGSASSTTKPEKAPAKAEKKPESDEIEPISEKAPSDLGEESQLEEAQPAEEPLRAPVFNEEQAHERIAEKTAKKVKAHLDERDLADTSARISLDEHAEKLEGVHERVDALHEKMHALHGKAGGAPNVSKKISSLSREIKSLKKANASTQALLKKLLKNQQSMLKQAKKKK